VPGTLASTSGLGDSASSSANDSGPMPLQPWSPVPLAHGLGSAALAQAATAPLQTTLPQAIAELEGRAIRAALQATGGNKVAAARMLGIARATLYEKLSAMESPET
jgi:DNA-binding NtrC family response regulator